MKDNLTYEELDFHNSHPGVRFQWDGSGTGCPVCDQFCRAIQPMLSRAFKQWELDKTILSAEQEGAYLGELANFRAEIDEIRGNKGEV